MKFPLFKNVFNDYTSYLVFFNLLYLNGKYEELVDVYQDICSSNIDVEDAPSQLFGLVLASYYKMVFFSLFYCDFFIPISYNLSTHTLSSGGPPHKTNLKSKEIK